MAEGAVVITGASTGIGHACALELDKRGFRVFAGVRRTEDAEALRKEGSDRLVPVMLDVTDEASLAAAAREVDAALGERGLQGLVNNAGIVVAGPLEALPLPELRKQLDVNVLGVAAATQAFLPMLRRGRGRIVNMGSICGLLSTPFMGPYCMSKYALEAYSDALRAELRPWGIEVCLIEPGSIATPIWEKSRREGAARYEQFSEEARELYGDRVQRMRRAAEKMGAKGIPAARVAEAVAHALSADRPRTRYLIGRDARLLRFMARWVPDRLRDRLILKGMGLA